MFKSSIIYSIVLCSFMAKAGQEIEFPEFDKELAAKGIALNYSSNSYDLLINELINESNKLRAKNEKKATKLADIIDKEIQELRSVSAEELNNRVAQYRSGRSFLYSVRSEILGVQDTSGKLGKVFNFLGYGDTTIPYFTPEKRNIPMGETLVDKEAYNLVDTATGKEYVNPTELKGLTINQIAALDVRSDNTLWYQESELQKIKSTHGSAWNYLEKKIEEGTSKKLGENYSIDQARRILIFDDIKTTATSPKVDTEDLYGMSWKLKWGEEVHSEPIANRLYVNLGAKYADLVYANKGGEKDLILVLNKSDAESNDPANCSKIATSSKLIQCLLTSTYQFNLKPYILKTGTIDQATLNNPESPLSKLDDRQKSKLLGREFLVFNESMVEFQPKHVERLGAMSLNRAGAVEDRAKRGLVMFSYWIRNKDAKDDNNRGAIVDGKYIEYIHDLGASLANLRLSGFPNEIEPTVASIAKVNTNTTSSGKVKKVSSLEEIKLDMQVLYLPESFQNATLSDALWMGNKIANFSANEIRDAVAATQWPAFQQEAMLNKLISRRNNILKTLGIGQPIPQSTVNSIVIPLNTRAERVSAAEQTGLNLATEMNSEKAADLIEAAMKAAGIKFDKNGNANYSDTVLSVSKGVASTVSCEQSILVSLLERTVRPSGLSRRTARGADDKPLPACGASVSLTLN